VSRAPVRAPAREVRDEDASISLPEQLNIIANELNLLSYRHTQPEAFLERRNELVVRLRRLSKRVAGQPERRKEPTTTWRPPYDA
jgi:hypothetical protein